MMKTEYFGKSSQPPNVCLMSRKILRLRLIYLINTCYVPVEQHTYYQLSREVFLCDQLGTTNLGLGFTWLFLERWDLNSISSPDSFTHTACLRAMAQRGDKQDMERKQKLFCHVFYFLQKQHLSHTDIFASLPTVPFFPSRLFFFSFACCHL